MISKVSVMDDANKLRIITQTTASLLKFLPLDIINLIIFHIFEKQQHTTHNNIFRPKSVVHHYAAIQSHSVQKMFTTETYFNVCKTFCDYRDAMEFLSKIEEKNHDDIYIVETNCFVKFPHQLF